MAFEIAKAGWIHRQSTVLKRWKRNWLVLYQDGNLKYFESPDSHVAEEAINMAPNCINIQAGLQVGNVEPPPGLTRNCLLTIQFTNDRTWNLCAESMDDMSAWQMSLEQARVIGMHTPQMAPPGYAAPPGYSQAPPGYAPYPQQQTVVYTSHPTRIRYGTHPPAYVVQGQPGQTTVIYRDDPYYRRRNDGTDLAVGMMAGAALGTMMWGPMLWW